MAERKLGKFRLGQRVKVTLDVKTDYPAIGYIKGAKEWCGKHTYKVRFDKHLFKHPIIQQVYELWIQESQIEVI